jgi:peptide/nickel transport system permease protein
MKRLIVRISLFILILFGIVGLYAPFLASSKPLVAFYDGHIYFPLFRYLFYQGFFTKRIDLFFNILMFTLPVCLLLRRYWLLPLLQFGIFFVLIAFPLSDPAHGSLKTGYDWPTELASMNGYARLNQVLRYRQRQDQHAAFSRRYGRSDLPTLWQTDRANYQRTVDALPEGTPKRVYLEEKEHWLSNQRLGFALMPLLRPFHWEDDAGGQASLNRVVKWYDLTRINRKDLFAALIFGVRISLTVGATAVFLSLLIGIPLGSIAGYFGGRCDIWLCRFIEIWEAMPTFFMLLMLVAITASKSIFLVVAAIGIFGWTGMARYLRAEVLKQRVLPYVEAGRSMGFGNLRIMFRHILPNAIPPLLTLLPFAMMAAITSEAGLSFLGLGEEGSTSWGVLMDEGRTAFPGESYLLWPPAIALTLLLIAIAIVGDALRDKLDPRMRTV